MDRHFSFAQRFARAAPKYALNFGDNGKRDFLRGFCAEIEPRGREEPCVNRYAHLEKVVEQLVTALSRANQSNVSQLQRQQFFEGGEIASRTFLASICLLKAAFHSLAARPFWYRSIRRWMLRQRLLSVSRSCDPCTATNLTARAGEGTCGFR